MLGLDLPSRATRAASSMVRPSARARPHLWCTTGYTVRTVRGTYGARYVRYAVRTVRGTYGTPEVAPRGQGALLVQSCPPGASCPAPQVRAVRSSGAQQAGSRTQFVRRGRGTLWHGVRVNTAPHCACSSPAPPVSVGPAHGIGSRARAGRPPAPAYTCREALALDEAQQWLRRSG